MTVADGVAVALLGEEQLAIDSELLISRIAGDDRVEVRERTVGFGTEDASEPLGFFLTRAEGARYLNRDIRIGEVNCKIGDLGNDEQFNLALAETVRTVRHAQGSSVCPIISGAFRFAAIPLSCSIYCPITRI